MIDKINKGINNPRDVLPWLLNKGGQKCRNFTVALSARKNIGTNIFDIDWDMAIILDACRVDIMQSVANEYDFIQNINQTWSVGGATPEWMVNTFDREYSNIINNTGYITANPHSKSVFENRLSEHFRGKNSNGRTVGLNRLNKYGRNNFVGTDEMACYHPAWADQDPERYEHYNLYGSPKKVTDRTIEVDRNLNPERIIAHYMPPHDPYIINAMREDRNPELYEKSPWIYLQNNGNKQDVKKVCADMLRWGLDEVQILLKNTERKKVLITSDHGDAFGELRTYSHHVGSFHPFIRKVPVVTTTAEDSGEYVPDINYQKSDGDCVEDRLKTLGYL